MEGPSGRFDPRGGPSKTMICEQCGILESQAPPWYPTGTWHWFWRLGLNDQGETDQAHQLDWLEAQVHQSRNGYDQYLSASRFQRRDYIRITSREFAN